jgi:hypothetical protein
MATKQAQAPGPEQKPLSRRPGLTPGLLTLLLGAVLVPGTSNAAGAREREPGLRINRIAASGEPFVLIAADATAVTNTQPSDVVQAQALQKATGQPVLWFRRGGAVYWVRDGQTVQKALSIVSDQLALSAEQAGLGAQQAELGRKQAELGQQQRELAQEQRELGVQQSQLAQQPETPSIVARQDEIGARQNEIGKEQDRIGKEQDALGKQADELGKRQDEIGRRQDQIGKEQERRIQAFLSDALAAGLAEEIGRSRTQ